MSNIYGLGSISSTSGNNRLLAAYGNDIVNVDTGVGYGLNLSGTNVEFEPFLDRLFFQDFTKTPLTYDPDNDVFNNLHVKHTPISKYLKRWRNAMYLGFVKINGTNYPSRVMYSNFPDIDGNGNKTIQWGFMSGSNASVVAGSSNFTAANAGFKTYQLKVGDPLIIESGANAGLYTIASVDADQIIKINETFQSTQSNITYWAGGNWFDVETDNSDTIMGLSENSDLLLVYKQDTLHRYNGSSLRTVRGPGTSSNRSIVYYPEFDINIYFHGSVSEKTGIYMYAGSNSTNISLAIQPFIDAISSANYSSVVAWPEGNSYRLYVGNLSNVNSDNNAYNIEMNNAVFTYNILDNKWSVDPISDVIKSRTYSMRESGVQKIFIGNDSGEVFDTPSGYDFGGQPINFRYETKVIYPSGSDAIGHFTRIKIFSRDASLVNVYYKLWGTPYEVDPTWRPLGQIGRDTTELKINRDYSRASGIQLAFEESGTTERTSVIDKITTYFVPETTQIPEDR